MNQHVEAIKSALVLDDDTLMHCVLVQKSQKLRQLLDKVTNSVSDREVKYARIKELREEMDGAMDHILNDGETGDYRPVTQIAAELKRVNDSIDKEIDKVYDLISEADALRREVSDLTQKISEIPLVATAA